MLAGCLPMVLQLPFFSVMYRLFLSKTVGGQAERAAGQGPAENSARQSLADRCRGCQPHGLVFLGLFARLRRWPS